mmetsp:Transcript_17048/g.22080  ORF Transcript_17048/g.22080 Transcript_17048/m.22080 type:complete len:88 (+) Transcript_17048:379-642(+)
MKQTELVSSSDIPATTEQEPRPKQERTPKQLEVLCRARAARAIERKIKQRAIYNHVAGLIAAGLDSLEDKDYVYRIVRSKKNTTPKS